MVALTFPIPVFYQKGQLRLKLEALHPPPAPGGPLPELFLVAGNHPLAAPAEAGDGKGDEQVAGVQGVEETGYGGTHSEQLAAALDATGGFNQVVVALKAWVEYGVALDVVGDHA